MTKKQVAELVKLCDCPEIQKLWKPKEGEEYWVEELDFHSFITDDDLCSIKTFGFDSWNEHAIWLPRIEDVLDILRIKLDPKLSVAYIYVWHKSKPMCRILTNKKINLKITGNTPRIACLKALRSVLKGE